MSGERKGKRSGKTLAVTLAQVRMLALALPKVEEGPSYGTPGFRVGGTLFARMHQDGDALVIRIDPDERSVRMRADPETFFITDHYRNYPWMLVRLSTVDPDDLRDLLEDAWRSVAPKRLVASKPPRSAGQ